MQHGAARGCMVQLLEKMNSSALQEAIKMAQMATQLNSNRSFAQKMAEATKAYAGLKPVGNIEKIVQGLRLYQEKIKHPLLDNPYGLGQAALAVQKMQTPLASALAEIHKSTIPFALADSIHAIGLHQAKILNNASSISALFKKVSLFSQKGSIQAAMLGMSGRIATLVAETKKWDLLKDFEAITEEAANISDRVVVQDFVSKDDIEKIKAVMGRIELKIDRKDKNALAVILIFMTFISFFLGLLSEGRNWIPKPEAATKEDIALLKKEVLQQAQAQLEETKANTITDRPCYVRLKPKAKSMILAKLPAGLCVVIFQKKHEWVYINYIRPIDGMAESGWVLKKYLTGVK